MTSRQARRERREAERKAKKAAYKAALATPPTIEEEFSPEFIAEARAARERVARRAVLPTSAPAPNPTGFVSQTAVEHAKTRAHINRANAQHSTGPVTPEGKLASSRNALKHGLASGELIVPGEDPAAFETLLQSLLDDHQPANTTEELLIQEMAQSYWLTQRALRLQNDCFTPDGVDEKRLALFLRYQTTHERAFHKALNTLIRLQKNRRRENSGFVSQPRASSTHQPGFVSQINSSTPSESPSVAQNAPPPLLADAA